MALVIPPTIDVITCRPMTTETTGLIRAEIVPLDRAGSYRIDAAAFSLKSRYPENRMAKVLFDAGYRGGLEVFGPSRAGDRMILRFACDIEKMAMQRMTEGEREIRFVAWTEESLAALEGITKRHPFSQNAKTGRPEPRLRNSNNTGPLDKGSSRDVKPVGEPTRDDPLESEAVT